jgi:hypothetical protein
MWFSEMSAIPGAAILPPAQTRDDERATEIAHNSTIQVDNCTAQDQARVQYGHTYVQNQYNGHARGPQEPSNITKRQIDFVEALAFDYMDSRYESIDPAHINTCRWLFKKPEYVQWRNSEHLASHNGFLWIKGKAGSGKSTLMKCAFEHARRHFRNDKIASFFFNARGQPLEKSVEGMYRSLLSQILHQFPHLRPVFPTFSPVSVQQQGWTVPALRNHLHRAIAGLGQGDAVALYVDALDECDEEEIREAIEHFEEIGSAALSMPISLHICFASRHYPRVSIQHCIEILLEEQAEHKRDIRRYINGRLAIRDTAFKARLAYRIESRASGVFFWVVLVVRLIKKRCDGGASHSEISKSLQEVPDKLQELIGAILHSPDNALLCTMRWILFAMEPMSLEELYFAIRTGIGQLTSGIWNTSEVDRDDMKAFILTSSRGLVEIKPHEASTRAQLIHESVRDYLITGGLNDLGCCLDKTIEANNHVRLFECCQTYLRLVKEEAVLSMDFQVSNSQDYITNTYPLFLYAGDHILHHFEVACVAGVLHLDSLRKIPLRHCVRLVWEPRLRRQLLEPHRLFLSLLFLSIYSGCEQLAEALLVENTVRPSRFEDRGCKSAAASNSELLAAEIDLNLHFEGHWPSLLELAVKRCPRLLRPLLDHGADVNINGGALLHVAIKYCEDRVVEDIVLLLLCRGAHIHSVSKTWGSTVLASAVEKGNLAIVKLLLEHGADSNGAYGSTEVSPLLVALGHEDVGYTDWHELFKHEPDYYSVRKDMVRVLINHGADVHLIAGRKQISPWQCALESPFDRHGDIISLLDESRTAECQRHGRSIECFWSGDEHECARKSSHGNPSQATRLLSATERA